MASADRANNSLKTAQVIRNPGNAQTLRNQVGRLDRDDLYRLQVGSASSLNLSATAKGGKPSLQIFSLKQPLKTLKTIGRTPFSDLSRPQLRKYITPLATSRANSQPVSLKLEAGTYYLRVAQAQGRSNYRLSLAVAATLAPGPSPTPGPSPIPGPNPTPGPNPIPNPTPAPSPSFSLPAFRAQTWVRQFGTAQNDYAFGTALDGNSVYVGGVNSPGNAFSGSGFVTQYLQDGTLSWQRSLSGSSSSTAMTAVADVAADDSGNYYVVGATLDGTNSDGFIAKYSAAGQRQWLKTIQSTVLGFGAADAASGVFIDDQNNIYVTGIRRGVPAPLSQQGKAFIAKYASNGDLKTDFGNNGIVEFGTATTAASGITVANGRVSITGITEATLSLSNGSVNLTGGDAFVASFDRMSGTLIWNQTLSSGSSTDYGRGIAASGSDLYIVGQTAGALPSGSLAANAYGGGESDAFLAKYTVSGDSGSLQWNKQIGGSGLDAAQAIAVGPTGQIYLTGETNTNLFGSALGGSDAWIAQADTSGNLLSASQIGTAQNDEAYSLTTERDGRNLSSRTDSGQFSSSQQPQPRQLRCLASQIWGLSESSRAV